MRRIRLILAVAAMMAISLVGSAPAMASHDHDSWWDSCGWSWSWWWGWFIVCEPDYDSWGPMGDDSTVLDYSDHAGDEGDDDVELSL